MRRSWAFAAVGTLATVLTIGTVSARSSAAGRPELWNAASPEPVPWTPAPPLELWSADSPRQALFGTVPGPTTAGASAPLNEPCPPSMVEVEGDYCPLVEQKCLRWLDPPTKLQCAEFAPSVRPEHCALRTEHKRFCIDRYEWPNEAGAMPVFMTSFLEARSACADVGKRLCGDTEWTLACEGPERQPYPYGAGLARDDRACNIDKPYIWPKPERLFDPRTRDDELARLDQREPSGSRPACVSPFGVHDMAGNVDEWVVNVSQSGHPYASALKGGYWGPVRTRCRPMTTAHDETFRYYQIGFRCCADPRPPQPSVDSALADGSADSP
jgi:hypothetical protein